MALTPEQEKMRASGKYVGIFPFQFDATVDGKIPTTIQLIPIGHWDHNVYGPIDIKFSDIEQYKQNFDAKVRKGVFITAGHEGQLELPAQGWITQVYARDTGLWGDVEWNKIGEESLKDKHYKFFSPEFFLTYEDPETHEIYRNVLTGGALTKSPYFKGLEAVVFSDKDIKISADDNKITMNIKDILSKKPADRSAEEKKFLEDNKATMSEAETKQFSEENESPEDKTKREASELVAKNRAAGLNDDGSKKITATEIKDEPGMLKISAAEYKILTGKADEGAAAFAELKTAKLKTAVGALVMSESNKAGRFLPKSEVTLKSFMEQLNDDQRKVFADLIGQLPEQKIFKEVGDTGAGATGTVMQEVETKIATLQASDKALGYSEALRKVFAETPGLQTRYDAELQG